MLPHRSILSNCRGAFELMRPLHLRDEVYLSYSAGVAQLRAHGGPVLLAEHRHRNRLLPRCRTFGGRYADGAAHHPDRGAARAGGHPQPRADASGTRTALAAGAVPAGDRTRHEARRRRAAGRARRALLDALLDRLVRAKVRARFGGRLEAAMSGGRAAGAGGGPVLPGARADDHAGLRPDRGRPGDQRQSAGCDPHRYRRTMSCRASICASPRTARSWCAATW